MAFKDIFEEARKKLTSTFGLGQPGLGSFGRQVNNAFKPIQSFVRQNPTPYHYGYNRFVRPAVQQIKQTQRTPQYQRFVQNPALQTIRGLTSPEPSMVKQRLLGVAKVGTTAANLGNRISPVSLIPSVRNRNRQAYKTSQDFINRNRSQNLAGKVAFGVGENLPYFAIPAVGMPARVARLSPLRRIITSGAIRGGEMAGFNTAIGLGENRPLKQVAKEIPSSFAVGAGLNTILSPRIALQASKQLLKKPIRNVADNMMQPVVSAMGAKPPKKGADALSNEARGGYKAIKGKDTIGRDIPDWRDAIVYHSTDAKSAENISKNGWKVSGKDDQFGYYGHAISTTPNMEYTKQFGDVLTTNKVDPSANILNLNDEKDWNAWLKLTDNGNASPDTYRAKALKSGIDGVYDPGAGDLFIYNDKKLTNVSTSSNVPQPLSPQSTQGASKVTPKINLLKSGEQPLMIEGSKGTKRTIPLADYQGVMVNPKKIKVLGRGSSGKIPISRPEETKFVAGGEPTIGRKILRQLTSGEAELKRMGKSGGELAKTMTEQQKAEDMFRGAYEDRLNQALRGLSKKERLNVSDILDTGAEAISDKAKKSADTIRKTILNEIGEKAQKIGLEIRTPEGSVPFKMREDYFPRKYNLTDIQKADKRQKILEQMVESGQAQNIAQADKIFQDFIISNSQRRAGQLEYARLFDMPGYEKDPQKAIGQYIQSASRRLSESAYYGTQDEVAQRLIDKVRLEGGDHKYAQEVFDLIVRNKKYNNPVVDAAMKFNVVTKLDLGFLTNLTQITNTATKTGVVNTLGSLLETFTKPRQAISKAVKAGSIEAPIFTGQGEGFDIGKTIGGILWGFRKSEEFNRVVATGAGERFTKKLADKLTKNPNSAYALRQLKSLGVDVEKIVATGKVTPDDILSGAKSTSDITQFTYSPLAVPPSWKTNLGKLLAQFKSFSFQQTRFVRDEVVKEATKGNVLPLVRLLAIGMPLSYGAATLRAKMTGRNLKEDEKSLDIRKLDYYLKAIGTLPTDLIAQGQFLADTYKNQYASPLKKMTRTASSILGPTVGELGNVATALEDIATKKTINKDLGAEKEKYDPYLESKRLASSWIPLAGENIKNTFFPYKSSSGKSEEDKQRGKDYYAIKDDIFKRLTTRERNVFEATGTDETPSGWESIAKASLLISNPEVLQAKTELQLRMAKKTGENPDPLYLLETEQQKMALMYQASKLNKSDKKAIIDANPWLPEYWNARSEYFDAKDMKDYEGYEGTRKYYEPSAEILAKQEKYFALPEKSAERKAYLAANQDLIDHWDKQQSARNQERAAMGLPPEEESGYGYGYGYGKKAKKLPTFKPLPTSLTSAAKIPISKATRPNFKKFATATKIPVSTKPRQISKSYLAGLR